MFGLSHAYVKSGPDVAKVHFWLPGCAFVCVDIKVFHVLLKEICLIGQERTAMCKEYRIKTHFSTKHSHNATKLSWRERGGKASKLWPAYSAQRTKMENIPICCSKQKLQGTNPVERFPNNFLDIMNPNDWHATVCAVRVMCTGRQITCCVPVIDQNQGCLRACKCSLCYVTLKSLVTSCFLCK